MFLVNIFFRALARIGSAHSKKDNLKEALAFYNKSLSEHRSADVVQKVAQVGCDILHACFLAVFHPSSPVK